MNTDNIDRIMEKISQAQNTYAKAMEMIAIISAGTIAAIVALRPQGQGAIQTELLAAVILLFIAILTTIFWFISKGNQYTTLARKMLNNRDGGTKTVKEPWFGRVSRWIALSAFITSYYCLFQSLMNVQTP